MDDTPTCGPGPDPEASRHLRYLRILVTTLGVTMIAGFVVLIAVLVTRLPWQVPPPLPSLPARIALPEGTLPLAVTAAPGWYAVVTRDGRILVFDAETGALRREVTLDGEPAGATGSALPEPTAGGPAPSRGD